MSILDLMHYGGNEIINTARLSEYIDRGFTPGTWQFGECFCPEIADLLGEKYTTPQLDDAPWVDPQYPESFDFAGVLPLSVEGLTDGVVTRNVRETITGRTILGREKCGPREIRVTALLVGATCCSIEYGLTWLANALRGRSPVDCSTPCVGDTMEFLRCCPDCDHREGIAIRSEGRFSDFCGSSIQPRFDTDYCDCYNRYARCIHDVGLTNGPTVVERIGSGCGACGGCPLVKVEWTFIAGDPSAYGNERCIITKEKFEVLEAECTTFTTDPPDGDNCTLPDGICDDAPVCELELPCGVIPPPPVPKDPFANCGCSTPLDVVVGEMVKIEKDDVPCFGQMVPIIKVYAGSEKPLKNFSIFIFENRLDRDCDFFLDSSGRPEECLACNVISIAHIPTDGLLEINGETQVADIQCRGGAITDATPVLFGENGRLFSFPILACTSYCIVAVADAENISEDAFWSLCLVQKET